MDKFNNLKTYEEYRNFHVATGWETEQGEENVERSQSRSARKDPNEPFFNKNKKEYYKGKAREFRTKEYQKIYDDQEKFLTNKIKHLKEIADLATEDNIMKVKGKSKLIKILLKDGTRLQVDSKYYTYVAINVNQQNEKEYNELYDRFGGYDIKRTEIIDTLMSDYNSVLKETARKFAEIANKRDIVF